MLESTFSTFTDPVQYQAAIPAAEVEVLVTANGNFCADLTKIDSTPFD